MSPGGETPGVGGYGGRWRPGHGGGLIWRWLCVVRTEPGPCNKGGGQVCEPGERPVCAWYVPAVSLV